jgi:hypothetical protein
MTKLNIVARNLVVRLDNFLTHFYFPYSWNFDGFLSAYFSYFVEF